MWNVVVMYISRLLSVDIPMGTNCAPLVADVFLYSYMYEADFVQHQQKSKFKIKNILLTFRYVDDVLSLNNPTFNYYIDVIYPEELEIKDNTDAPKDQNGLMIVTFVWSLMKMIHLTHDSMTIVMTLIYK